MNATEVAAAVEKRAVVRDTGKRDIAAAAGENLAAGGMDFGGAEGRCGSSGPAIVSTSPLVVVSYRALAEQIGDCPHN